MPQNPSQFSTQGIILARTDFGEADRMLTFLTPDYGKLKAAAKGVRKAGAKLAGAIELFSVTDITLVMGRGEVDTLISARLQRHYGNIVKDIERTNTAYELLRLTDKSTESRPESTYFDLLNQALEALNDGRIDTELTELWFKMQLLKIAGHAPNLRNDEGAKKLVQSKAYRFDLDGMCFKAAKKGDFDTDHIKFLRLGFSNNTPKALQRIDKVKTLINDCLPLIDTILKTYVRI